MADIVHRHGAPPCRNNPTRHNASCSKPTWSWICSPQGGGRYNCTHIDPTGAPRVVRLLKKLGFKVNKGHRGAHGARKTTARRRRSR